MSSVMSLPPFFRFCCLLFAGLCGAADALQAQPEDLFAQDELLPIIIQANLAAIQNDRGEDPDYHGASLCAAFGEDTVAMMVNLRCRGNYRRDTSHCAFPPLKVRLKKDQRTGTPFEGHRTLKLVTHCQEDPYVLREYLTYRMYQLLTPRSFRVRLARITYQDLSGTYPTETHVAFLLEDDDVLAERLGGEKWEIGTSPDSLDRAETTLLYLFQYAIGNLDWSTEQLKNMELIRTEPGEIFPIPYDFDFSRLVNAPYTGLDPTDDRRYLRKLCRTEEEWQAALDQFIGLEPAFKALIEGCEPLPRRDQRAMWSYLEDFLKVIQKEKKVENLLADKCEQAEN